MMKDPRNGCGGMFRRTVGRHALMPPTAPAIPQVPARAHIQCAPTPGSEMHRIVGAAICRPAAFGRFAARVDEDIDPYRAF